MSATGLAPDRAMADILAAVLAAHDAVTDAAHRVVSEHREDGPPRRAAQQWLTQLGPALFARVPQSVIDHANHLAAVSAKISAGVASDQLPAIFEALEKRTTAEVRRVYALDEQLEAFRVTVTAAAGESLRGSALRRFHEATDRLRQLSVLALAAWKRVLAAMLVLDLTALENLRPDLQHAADAWRQLAILGDRLQQSDTPLSTPSTRPV